MNQEATAGGTDLRQTTTPRAPNPAARVAAPQAARVLLTAEQAARDVLGISERAFHTLRSRGMIPDPVSLGPRSLRWVRAELEAAALSLPRQSEARPQPAQ